jgi:hypothetical protein
MSGRTVAKEPRDIQVNLWAPQTSLRDLEVGHFRDPGNALPSQRPGVNGAGVVPHSPCRRLIARSVR